MANRLRKGIERSAVAITTGIALALGTAACATPAEKPPATATAPTNPSEPTPSEGNPVETPKVTVTFETPKEQLDPLTAKEALNIPDELDGDALAAASHEGAGAIYDKFRAFMTLENAENMGDEELAQKVYKKLNGAWNAKNMMHLSDNYGDENKNISKKEIHDQCAAALNGTFGDPESRTLNQTGKIACEQRFDMAQADIIWTKGNAFVDPRHNDKPYKEGMIFDKDSIVVIDRDGNTVRFSVKVRSIRITNPDVEYNAGLKPRTDSDNTTQVTYEAAIGEGGSISIARIDDKQ